MQQFKEYQSLSRKPDISDRDVRIMKSDDETPKSPRPALHASSLRAPSSLSLPLPDAKTEGTQANTTAFQLSPDESRIARFHDALIRGWGVRGEITLPEVEAIKTILRQVESHACGGTLLRTLVAYYEYTGKLPQLILHRGASDPVTEGSPQNTELHLDADSLWNYDTTKVVNALKTICAKMIGGVLAGGVGGPHIKAIAEGKVPIDPALETMWQHWINDDEVCDEIEENKIEEYQALQRQERTRIVDKQLRRKLQLLLFYGGVLPEYIRQLIELRPGDYHHQKPLPPSWLILDPELLSTGVPPLPDVDTLDLYDYRVTSKDKLPAHRFLNVYEPEGEAVKTQLHDLPDFPASLRELERRNRVQDS